MTTNIHDLLPLPPWMQNSMPRSEQEAVTTYARQAIADALTRLADANGQTPLPEPDIGDTDCREGFSEDLLVAYGESRAARSFVAALAGRERAAPVSLPDHIDKLAERHGSLRAAARVLEVDPGYLARLRSGEKDDPGATLLRRMGLRRAVTYTPTTPPASAPARTSGDAAQGERVADVLNEMEAFEAWWQSVSDEDMLDSQWNAWKARAALAAQPGATVKESLPVAPTNDVLNDLWGSHQGHPADFAADVLERWGGWQYGILGYGGSLNKPQAQPAAASEPVAGWQIVPVVPRMQDHEIAATVNAVRDIALEFGHTQQLRSRIADLLVPILHGAPGSPVPPKCVSRRKHR